LLERKIVLPGDAIAATEEYEAGEGTYESEGHIYAAMPGLLDLDGENFVARVRPFNPPAELKVGDLVYGVVEQIRPSMAEANVAAVHGTRREITGETEGSIHVSKISTEYVDDIRNAFRLGDIIRAKVIQVRPSLQLTTAEPNLGVVKAICSRCRGPLEARAGGLWCPRDELAEPRIVAADYGELRLSVPAKELGAGTVMIAPPEEGERRGRGGGRPRGGGGRERTGQRGGDRGRGRGGGGQGRGGGGRGRGAGRPRYP